VRNVSFSPVKPARKRKKAPAKAHLYRLRALLLMAVVSAAVGMFGGHLWAQGSGDIFGSNSEKTAAASKVTALGPTQDTPGFSTYPAWAQDFAKGSGQPDSNYWNIFRGAPQNDNEEAQLYTADAENVHIGNGALSLVATKKQQKDYRYASARVDTENKVSFLYGRIDVTAKLPSGAGTWPAIWLLPSNRKYTDLSPASDQLRHINGGELDIAEAVGINPDIVYGVVHTRSDLKNPDHIGDFNQVIVPGNSSGYNKYSLLWTPTGVTYEVNGKPFFTYTKDPGADYTTWPFDQPFYLILNLALGGKWAGQNTADFPGDGIDGSALPASLDIKSVYYYPYVGQR
jgi:beta-glucanase (GH16 family)